MENDKATVRKQHFLKWEYHKLEIFLVLQVFSLVFWPWENFAGKSTNKFGENTIPEIFASESGLVNNFLNNWTVYFL